MKGRRTYAGGRHLGGTDNPQGCGWMTNTPWRLRITKRRAAAKRAKASRKANR